ncbi:response regulator [Phycicoccus avicenniae]|uniref:response regulator n=1 Tax=Phycicoccus avicenniae TaxID=2828860 RepID=UPI003D2BD1C6
MRALVVDDSRTMRVLLGRLLHQMGFSVEQAADGQEALEAVESAAAAGALPDVCLVDWNMPVMTGLEFVVAVRAKPAWRDINLMMVTTESEHGQIVRALAAGAHEYLIKPFPPEAIEEKLQLLGLVPAS